eukprot:1277132-Pyramimonas_sp.AAC.1
MGASLKNLGAPSMTPISAEARKTRRCHGPRGNGHGSPSGSVNRSASQRAVVEFLSLIHI